VKLAEIAVGPQSDGQPAGQPAGQREGLRERKKRLTRKAIFDTAQRLFSERGFDDVTVAEIADAANVSVKTLFTYVRSKEELLFADEPNVLDAVVAAVRARRVGQTPLVAAATALLTAVDEASPVRGLDGFRRMTGESPAARARLRVLWEETEDALTDALSGRKDGPRERAARRLVAAQIMVLVRTVTSDEVTALVDADDNSKKRREALREWIRDAAGSLARGLQAAGR
jgi:AcrR family transcriptional regulator